MDETKKNAAQDEIVEGTLEGREIEEISEEQIAESERGLCEAILRHTLPPHQRLISEERYSALVHLEHAAYDMARYVGEFFGPKKSLEARKLLILKAAEVEKSKPFTVPTTSCIPPL